MKRQNPEKQSNLPKPKKRHKTSLNSKSQSKKAHGSNKSAKSKKKKVSFMSLSEMESLIEIFLHLQSQGIQNRTLDQMIYESFCHLYHRISPNSKALPLPQSMQQNLIQTLYPTKKYQSSSYWCQIRQLKAQLHGYRYLSRDLPVSQKMINLIHGDNNPHSKQRLYIDPTIISKDKEKSKLNRFDLNYKKQWIQDNLALTNNNKNINDNNNFIIDNTPQTIESLVYQNEYNGLNKLLDRRCMLSKYVKDCQNSKETIGKDYNNSVKELQYLKLIELQRSMKHSIMDHHLFLKYYENDDTENEALLNPNGFQRRAKVGLQFDQHINTINHPPSAVKNFKHEYPFHFKGES